MKPPQKWMFLPIHVAVVAAIVVAGQNSYSALGSQVISPDPMNGSSLNADFDTLRDCCEDRPVNNNRTVVKLGYLAAVKGDLSNRSVPVNPAETFNVSDHSVDVKKLRHYVEKNVIMLKKNVIMF
jgi:hypothetical protein